jgi:hypothetical protein
MVAIRFKSPEPAADGFMLLVRQGRVRTLRGEIYVCQQSALNVLDLHQIAYEKVPYPQLNEADVLRDTPTTEL